MSVKVGKEEALPSMIAQIELETAKDGNVLQRSVVQNVSSIVDSQEVDNAISAFEKYALETCET